MTCQECLSELASGSLRDLSPESEVMRHCSTCPDCGPLATLLRDREYNAATTLNSLPPMSNPISVAETAALVAHRRTVGKVVVFLTGVALAATILISLFVTDFGRRMVGGGGSSLHTVTISLTCLSPQQAGDIIDPYFRTRGSIYFVNKSGVPAITVRGTPYQVRKARDLIREFERDPQAGCRNPFLDRMREVDAGIRKAAEANPAPTIKIPANPTK